MSIDNQLDIVAEIAKIFYASPPDLEVLKSLISKVKQYDEIWKEKAKPFEIKWFYELKYSKFERFEFLFDSHREWWLQEYNKRHNNLQRGERVNTIPDKIVQDFKDKSKQFFIEHPCPVLQSKNTLNRHKHKSWICLLLLIYHDDYTQLEKFIDEEILRPCDKFRQCLSRYVNNLGKQGIEELLVCVAPKKIMPVSQNEKSSGSWYWRLYETTLKILVDAILERFLPKPK